MGTRKEKKNQQPEVNILGDYLPLFLSSCAFHESKKKKRGQSGKTGGCPSLDIIIVKEQPEVCLIRNLPWSLFLRSSRYCYNELCSDLMQSLMQAHRTMYCMFTIQFFFFKRQSTQAAVQGTIYFFKKSRVKNSKT